VDEDAAREEAAAGAAAAWVRAERAQRRLEAREEDVALAEQLLSDARELLDAGVGVRLDVTRARAQLATVRAGLVSALSEVERSRLALKRALNVPLDRPVALTDRWPEPPAGPAPGPSADTAVSGALGRRPDLLALDQRIDAAELDLAAVDAERLPTLSLAVGDGFTGAGYDHLLNTYEWVFRVSVPVFTGKAHGARSEAEQARVAALETRREELARQVAFNVRDALLRLGAARELVEASRTRLSLAEDEVSQARERFAAGASGSADLFNATLRLNEARTAVVDALAGWHAARVSLAAAEGAVTSLR
jgi:outer membrane protein TolC